MEHPTLTQSLIAGIMPAAIIFAIMAHIFIMETGGY